MLLYDAFRKIAEALNKEGIQAVALKGIYLADFFCDSLFTPVWQKIGFNAIICYSESADDNSSIGFQ